MQKTGSRRSSGVGNGNPFQSYSMDRGAWCATVQGVTKSWTWLSTHTHTHTHTPFPVLIEWYIGKYRRVQDDAPTEGTAASRFSHSPLCYGNPPHPQSHSEALIHSHLIYSAILPLMEIHLMFSFYSWLLRTMLCWTSLRVYMQSISFRQLLFLLWNRFPGMKVLRLQ